jgi:hypothetical protein
MHSGKASSLRDTDYNAAGFGAKRISRIGAERLKTRAGKCERFGYSDERGMPFARLDRRSMEDAKTRLFIFVLYGRDGVRRFRRSADAG